MVKRRPSEQDEGNGTRRKRGRYEAVDRLSILSDELVLRTLSFLPVSSLVVCQRYTITECTHVSAFADFVGYHTGSTPSPETPSSGSLPTTNASYAPERHAFQVFEIKAAQRRHSFTPRVSRDGLRTSTWCEKGKRRIGRSNTSFATIGQGAVAMSGKSKLRSALLCHQCWYDCMRTLLLRPTACMG